MVPAAQGEVVHAQHLRDRVVRIGQCPDLAQQRHPAHRRGQLPGQPRSRAAAQGQRDRGQRTLQDQRATGILGRQLRHLLGESCSAAIGVVAEQSANPQPDQDLTAGDRGIGQPTPVTAVDPPGQHPAAGTADRILTGRGLDPHRRPRRTDHLDPQTVQMREQDPHQFKIRTLAT